jgi:hypothetical protein
MKDKEFYELGKKMFDRLNPPGTPEFKPYFPKREWVGLTDDEFVLVIADCAASHQHMDIHLYRAIEAKLKELNHDLSPMQSNV